MSERRCAFCGESAPLTREHVWPRCISQKRKGETRFLGKNRRFFDGDLTVKDVCARCNNGALSALDNYVCGLYEAQLHLLAKPNQSLVFRYNYGLLLRWLLKISYNSARVNNTDEDVLARYCDFILTGKGLPEGLVVPVELVRPSKHTRKNGAQFIWPDTLRCARVQIGAAPLPGYCVRLVSIRSFYFYLVIETKEALTDKERAFSEQMLSAWLPATKLGPEANQLTLRAGGRRTLDAHRDWIGDPLAMASMANYKARKGVVSN